MFIKPTGYRQQGLSPRTRGNRIEGTPSSDSFGPIPANAGEPSSSQLASLISGAYPRERGGTCIRPQNGHRLLGLPPRTRGNRLRRRSHRRPRGPIPANAGEPDLAGVDCLDQGAYPRERGGTGDGTLHQVAGLGLSPRTRGNLLCWINRGVWSGPIPANAGEPRPARPSRSRLGAYPRERGGTTPGEAASGQTWGLSPRTRGNLNQALLVGNPRGPIPANAGEPRKGCHASHSRWAYPRERGGTIDPAWSQSWSQGLSPRTRGNHHRRHWWGRRQGPIPANAGEPKRQARTTLHQRAYPRERGGTASWLPVRSYSSGLSPRTRGNHAGGHVGSPEKGPIPANAGEPRQRLDRRCHQRAYPRERGGTGKPILLDPWQKGLSPRTRGNLTMVTSIGVTMGPIPANAGEPFSRLL